MQNIGILIWKECEEVMRYNLTPARMGIMKKSKNTKCWRGCGENGTLEQCCWKCKSVQSLWKIVQRLLKKLKIELPYDLEIPHLGTYLKKIKTLVGKDTCTLLFIAALLTVAKIRKQAKCPQINEWVKKMWYVCVYIFTYTRTYTQQNVTQPENTMWFCHLQWHGWT